MEKEGNGNERGMEKGVGNLASGPNGPRGAGREPSDCLGGAAAEGRWAILLREEARGEDDMRARPTVGGGRRGG